MQILSLINYLLVLEFFPWKFVAYFWKKENKKEVVFASPKKLRKGTVLFLMEIQTTLVTVCDRLLKDLGLAPKPWLISRLPLQAERVGIRR